MKLKGLAITFLLVAPLSAQADEIPITISADLPFFNKYVWRGVNLINDPVLQPSIDLEYKGWNLNLWGNYDINNAKRFDEYDVTLSYSGELPQGSWTAGYIDYNYPGADVQHSQEFFGRFALNQNLNPYIELNIDTDEVRGFYARAGVETGFTNSSGDFNFHSWISYGDKNMNNSLYGNNKSGLADFGIEATWSKQLSSNTTGYVNLGFTSLLNKDHLAGEPNRNNLIFGFGLGIGL